MLGFCGHHPLEFGDLLVLLFDLSLKFRRAILRYRLVSGSHDCLALFDPLITGDAAGEVGEGSVYGCDSGLVEGSELLPGDDAEAVEQLFHLWADSRDDFEVIGVIGTVGAELGLAALPSACLKRCETLDALGHCRGSSLLFSQQGFELGDTSVPAVEIVAELRQISGVIRSVPGGVFQRFDTTVFLGERYTQLSEFRIVLLGFVELALKVRNAGVRTIELTA